MPNLFIPRERLHAWVDEVALDTGRHKGPITYLVQSQRRLAKYVDGNAKTLSVGGRGVALFLQGLVARIFDLSGGKVTTVSYDQIHGAEVKVAAVVGDLLPPDDGFAERVRQVDWRAQPHILDECLQSLFDDEELDRGELVKMFLLLWVVVEVLDENWTPGADFDGQSTYETVHIEPPGDAE